MRGPPGVSNLLGLVLGQYRLSPAGTHGVSHWARVLENARRLAPFTGADLQVLELFALFHDACRLNEGIDPQHGPRAARLLSGIRSEVPLDDGRFALLVQACACHTRGPRPGAPVTVLTCLDADRLDIPRVGMAVRTGLLFSDAARDPDTISWATRRARRREVPELCLAEWGWTEPIPG